MVVLALIGYYINKTTMKIFKRALKLVDLAQNKTHNKQKSAVFVKIY